MPSPLRFREDGTFQIVQFTDLHWGNGGEEDQRTLALMERILEAERPDLVMLTGDVIAGSECTDPARSWRDVVAPMEARSLPWAAVFGNHDDEGSLSRAELMAVQQSCRGCLSEPGPETVSGVGNYVLTVQSARHDMPAAALYCFDSQSYAPKDIGGYGWVLPDQIAWYLTTSRHLTQSVAEQNRLDRDTPLPALAFLHIPLPEYDTVWDEHVCRGVKYEVLCSPRLNTGLFAAFYEARDVLGVFVGHDHVNDYEGTLYGIRLCYGRASGYNTYGREGMTRGARVIRLREGARGFESWLRLDDGSIITVQPEHLPQGRTLTADDEQA
jgi:hypothetical protein